jgi:hypothetical protein
VLVNLDHPGMLESGLFQPEGLASGAGAQF